MWWVMEVRDDALIGQVRGQCGERPAAGPYATEDEARKRHAEMRAMLRFAGSNNRYYKVKESEKEPKDTEKDYEFVDARDEFEDV